jgi:hypothetical protein
METNPDNFRLELMSTVQIPYASTRNPQQQKPKQQESLQPQ